MRRRRTSRGKSLRSDHAKSSDSKMVRFSLMPCLTNSFSKRPRNSRASCGRESGRGGISERDEETKGERRDAPSPRC